MSVPRVSVCIPAYEVAEHVDATLDSVWAQTFADFEVVVVEDGSTDATAERLAAHADPRLRVVRHPRNRGQRRTVGEAVGQARAELVKFLDADDLLHPDCLEKMVRALDAHPRAAFVFSTRDVLAEQPEDPATVAWIEQFGTLHDGFGALSEVNDGGELLRRYLDAGMGGNWIAEPAGVMARRAALLSVGGYPLRVRQATDMDLWMRLMARGDVVFLDEPLYTYRFALEGVTGASAAGRRQWLDTVWIAEGLAALDGFPQPDALRRARRLRLRRALSTLAHELATRDPAAPAHLRDLLAYARFRLARAAGRAPALHDDFAAQLPLSSPAARAAPADRPADRADGPPGRNAGS